MGVDVRTGRRDYHTRYKVYPSDVDINNAIERDSKLIGVLHAKDITEYTTSSDTYSNSFQMDNVRATIETMDRIDVRNDYYIYAIAEKKWYRVTGVTHDSFNPSQRWSARPIQVTRIQLVTGDN